MDSNVNGHSSGRELSVAELARMVGGRIAGASGVETTITGTCAIVAYSQNKVSFVKNRKYGEHLGNVQRAVVLIPETLADLCERYTQNIYVVVADVMKAIMDVQDHFYGRQAMAIEEGVSSTAVVHSSAVIGSRVSIGHHVYVGKDTVIGDGTTVMHGCCILDNVFIGRNSLLYPGVYVHRRCQIGNDCTILPGTRIGTDGFRFEQDVARKTVRKMTHAGRVVIGNRVEIGANTAVDRATFESDATVISDDAKVDNLVHIAHNAKIGARTIIVAQSCIGGSATVGDDAWIGIGAAISNGVNIGARAKVLLSAVVPHDVADDEIVSGFYAMPHRQWKRVCSRLKEM